MATGMALLSAVAALPTFKVDEKTVGAGVAQPPEDQAASRPSSADVLSINLDRSKDESAVAPRSTTSYVQTFTSGVNRPVVPVKRKAGSDPHRTDSGQGVSKRSVWVGGLAGGSKGADNAAQNPPAEGGAANGGTSMDVKEKGAGSGSIGNGGSSSTGVALNSLQDDKAKADAKKAGTKKGSDFDDGGRFEAFLRAADAVLRPRSEVEGEENLIALTHEDISEITGMTGELDDDKVSNLRKVLSLPPRGKMEVFLEAVRSRPRPQDGSSPQHKIELTGEIPGATLVFPGVHELIKSNGWIIKNQIQDPKTSYAAWMAIRVRLPLPHPASNVTS
jgi:hypothetical protein